MIHPKRRKGIGEGRAGGEKSSNEFNECERRDINAARDIIALAEIRSEQKYAQENLLRDLTI